MSETLNLTDAKFRGPVRFLDGAKGMAQQDFECVDEPRFGYSWRRENRPDKGRDFYTVDGREVANLEEAATLLAKPVDAESPREIERRRMDAFKASPSLNYGATRGLSEAECNATAIPFGMIRSWLHRAGSAWHGGINRYSEAEREAGREFPFWLYNIKHAADEAYRAMYLFEADKRSDTDLQCALGVRCRECPILAHIEAGMTERRGKGAFADAIEDDDIVAAKVWTCIGHILTDRAHLTDGMLFATKSDRDWHGF